MKRNRKRILFILLTLILFVNIISGTSVKAGVNIDKSAANRYIQLNLETIEDLVNQSEEINNDISIKEGWKNKDVIYYPVYDGDRFFAYITVFQDENKQLDWSLNGLVSKEKIEELKNNSDTKDQYLFLIKLLNYANNSKTLYDIKKTTKVIPYSSNTRIISLKIREIQRGKPWCAAYASSVIINTKNGNTNTTALSIMRHFYPEGNISHLDNFGLTISQVNRYGRYRGFKTNVSGTLSMNQVRGQISNYSPIFIKGDRYSGKKVVGSHAFVISGYDLGGNKIYAWNPWGSYVWFSQSSKRIPAEGRVYIWDKSVINWHK